MARRAAAGVMVQRWKGERVAHEPSAPTVARRNYRVARRCPAALMLAYGRNVHAVHSQVERQIVARGPRSACHAAPRRNVWQRSRLPAAALKGSVTQRLNAPPVLALASALARRAGPAPSHRR
jgi:hypothetical protein